MVDLSGIEQRMPEWVTDSSANVSSEFAVHIFGPYRGECQEILEKVVQFLRDNGYGQANTCLQLPDHSEPDMQSHERYWWESVYCMNEADAAIFLILEPADSRLGGYSTYGVNTSVIAELTFWTHFFAEDRPSLVITEGEMADMGSLVPGIMDIYRLDKAFAEFDDIDRMQNLSLMHCNDWVRQR